MMGRQASAALVVLAVLAPDSPALTLGALLAGLEGRKQLAAFPFEAAFTTRIRLGNQSITDSGTFQFSPPHCFKLTLTLSKTEQRACGDTSWVRLPNGDVTRSIGPGGGSVAGLPMGAAGMGMRPGFDLLADTSAASLRIDTLTGEAIVRFARPDGMAIELVVDTSLHLVRRSRLDQGGAGSLHIAYRYELFRRQHMLAEADVVMGAGGSMEIAFSGFRKIKPIPRKAFSAF